MGFRGTKIGGRKIGVANGMMLRVQYAAEVNGSMIGRWEIYEEGENKPFAERVHVTLNRKHIFCLNAKVHEMMGRPEAVVLMFDRRENVIGLNPAPPSVNGAFRVRPLARRGGHKIIRAAPFCRHFGIRLDHTSAFIAPTLDRDGVLLLDLNAIAPARARRDIQKENVGVFA